MSRYSVFIVAPALMLAAACGNNDRTAAADTALNRDLTLAAQASPSARLDSISAAERMNGGVAAAPAAPRPTASAPRRTTTSSSTRRTSSSTRSSGTSSGRTSTSSGGTVASQPREVEVKHTKRDAAIGAAAGAVIGATTSRDKVKGAIIGGAAGAILGGIIGNNVDKGKKTVP